VAACRVVVRLCCEAQHARCNNENRKWLFHIFHSFILNQFLLFKPANGHKCHLIRSNICNNIKPLLVHRLLFKLLVLIRLQLCAFAG
jgi:hypothetical protein